MVKGGVITDVEAKVMVVALMAVVYGDLALLLRSPFRGLLPPHPKQSFQISDRLLPASFSIGGMLPTGSWPERLSRKSGHFGDMSAIDLVVISVRSTPLLQQYWASLPGAIIGVEA